MRPGARRLMEAVLTGEHDGTDAVRSAQGQEPDRAHRDEREVSLLALRGAEVEAGRPVDDDPRLELAVGDRVAHVRDVGAGGEVPVDAPDVVTDDVLASFARLGARCRDEPEVVALEQPVEAAVHLELEEPQRGFRPGERGRRCEGHAERSSSVSSTGTAATAAVGDASNWRGATLGITTVASTRRAMSSASTPSASASYESTRRWRSTSGATSKMSLGRT